MSIRLATKNKEVDPASFEKAYENAIETLIRQRYTIGNELAIIRQRDEKPEEFAAYTAYVEECKAAVKAEASGISGHTS